MGFDRGQRTEKPTGGKRRKAREDGKVAVSRDLVASTSLLLVLVAFRSMAPQRVAGMNETVRRMLERALSTENLTFDASVATLSKSGVVAFGTLLPVAALVVVTVFAATFVQIGWLFRPVAVVPDAGRLGLSPGTPGVSSPRAWGRGVFALLKCGWIGFALWWGVTGFLAGTGAVSIEILLTQNAAGAAWLGLDHLGDVAVMAASGLVVLGLADWLFQKWRHEDDLMMTREELLEEMSEQEPSAQTRQHRRSVARRLRSNHRAARRGGSE
jgi:flagellar biosynthetic protein FlhB